MNDRDFFNSLAFKWDEICNHDKIKLEKITDISDFRKNSKIIDIGTGTGIMLSYLLKTEPSEITAIDISENMLKIAESKYTEGKISFVHDDIFNFQGSEYDYALMYSVYPHFTDKTSLFEKIYALLSKGGAIIIAHSESREKINEVHSGSSHVENHILDSAEKTVLIMEKYFKIIKIIDSDEMYYIKGIKE